jgi:hypothetical protein
MIGLIQTEFGKHFRPLLYGLRMDETVQMETE